MLMPERLESHLSHNHIVYSLILHARARSAQVAASIMHVPGSQVAKAVALCAGEQVLLAVLPASHHINFEKLSAVVGKKVQLMEEEKCRELFPDCEDGAIPPFGELYDVPVYMDQALADDPESVFGGGTLSESLRIGNLDFIRLVKPRICSFADRTWGISKVGRTHQNRGSV